MNSILKQIFIQHMQMQMHIDPQHWKEYAQQIAPFIQKMQQTMKAIQAQQAAQQQAAGAPAGGPPMPTGNGSLPMG